ncbi:glycosyltransferase family 4 protein [Pelagovum pacificum]|uniref:Glycosyltransferase family 4 protein n=2 Tax=Pelagovum pacificum TaxID=2588711 RepID=A0A5C5GJS4_9RHOB|nr:glycosyltransferase family 1 protein [Pelagovum pacificum]QQA42857.1 glycosyltransferase family 4 protein [Pelagovum pacificum]TNY34397.1 glycosyltransferase family 4 protein [Pelagovum pacificum]
MSRAGRVLTGVDRVERAYLDALIRDEVPLFLLARSAFGYLLLDRDGARKFLKHVDSGDWGQPFGLSRLAYRLDPARQAAEATVRALSIARCTRRRLVAMLSWNLPAGTTYLNLGHTNLTDRVLMAVRSLPDARVTVFIHDTIPLDLPHMQRTGSVPRFASFLSRAALADRVLTSSQAVLDSLEHHIDSVPPVTVAPLGVDLTVPRPEQVPAELPPPGPYFVVLGTIEPRKNHALLLDIWEELEAEATLLILGSRGWNNEDVFARLDAEPQGVIEVAGLSDGAVASLLQGARALLFPSLAEGFGLPLIEAAALGTPVVCGDLAICREVLGDRGIYLATDDRYLWINTINELAEQAPQNVFPSSAVPQWSDHFKIVLSVT